MHNKQRKKRKKMRSLVTTIVFETIQNAGDLQRQSKLADSQIQ
jgi:hypothetical protein